jgi:BRCT domain type II-containing protein
MIPIASAPTISPPVIIEQQQLSSPSNILTSAKTDFDEFIDQQLQATLEKRLRSHPLPSTRRNHEEIQRQQLRKTRLATLTTSETGKLIDALDFANQVYDSEHYQKQVRHSFIFTS